MKQAVNTGGNIYILKNRNNMCSFNKPTNSTSVNLVRINYGARLKHNKRRGYKFIFLYKTQKNK